MTKKPDSAKYTRRTRAHAAKVGEIVAAAKDVPCMDCGVAYPYYVMTFDHVVGEKLFPISLRKGQMSLTQLRAEIAKCEIVCQNCHHERTWRRKQGGK